MSQSSETLQKLDKFGANSYLYNALYIMVAPRLYLIEYFTDLLAKINGN